jgi:hypothetical protein
MTLLASDAALAPPTAAPSSAAPAALAARMVSDTETARAGTTSQRASDPERAPSFAASDEVSESATTCGSTVSTVPSGPAPVVPPEVKAALERGASQLAGALGSGLRAASDSLEASSPGALEARLAEAPELDLTSADPLAALATRLAAESDFWQRLALRSLQRAVGADRASYALAAVALAGALGLGSVAAVGALFPGAHPGTRAALLALGGLALLVAALVGHVFTHTVRRTQHELAQRAQENAARAEGRLARLAFAVAQRRADPDAYRATLTAWLVDGSGR